MKNIKSVTSVLMIIMLMASFIIPAQAIPALELSISSSSPFYLQNEDIMFTAGISNTCIHDFEYAEIYISCNKDVLKYRDKAVIEDSENYLCTITETETGYTIYLGKRNTSEAPLLLGASFVFSVEGSGNPEVSACAKIKRLGSDFRDAFFYAEIPENIVYNRSELPVLSISEKYSAFFSDGVLYLPESMNYKEIKKEISCSPEGFTVEYYCRSFYSDTELACTDDFFYVKLGNTIAETIQICLMGDMDADGKITASDARIALRHAARIENFEGIGLRIDAGDVDFNGIITATDARNILRSAANIDTSSFTEALMSRI